MDGLYFIVFLGIAVASGFLAQYVASARGHSSLLFFWVGVFLPILGVLIAFVSPSPQTPTLPQSPPTASSSLSEQLRDLAELHADGVLSDEEFEKAKKRIIG